MNQFIIKLRSFNFRKFSIVILSFLWVLGLSYGLRSFRCIEDVSWLRSADLKPVATISPVMLSALPFLLFVICTKYRMDYIIFPVVFFEGFLLSFSMCVSFAIWGSGSWLALPLLDFSGYILAPIWLYIWIIKLGNEKQHSNHWAWLFVFFAVVIVIIDTVWIKPFAQGFFGRK